jgi:hypothetical protein
MATAPRTARRPSGATVVLLVLAVLLYVFTVSNAAETPYLESIDKDVAVGVQGARPPSWIIQT